MGKLPFHLLSFILEFKAVELPDISVPLWPSTAVNSKIIITGRDKARIYNR
jgi:hypothetical protein